MSEPKIVACLSLSWACVSLGSKWKPLGLEFACGWFEWTSGEFFPRQISAIVSEILCNSPQFSAILCNLADASLKPQFADWRRLVSFRRISMPLYSRQCSRLNDYARWLCPCHYLSCNSCSWVGCFNLGARWAFGLAIGRQQSSVSSPQPRRFPRGGQIPHKHDPIRFCACEQFDGQTVCL